MNIITRIALSFSLITLIAQPVQAASYTDHATKAARIFMHTAQTAAGAYIAWSALSAYKAWKAYNEPRNGEQRKKYWLDYDQQPSEQRLARIAKLSAISTLTFLYQGLSGIKRETCPNFKPLSSLTDKIPTKAKKTTNVFINALQVFAVALILKDLRSHSGLENRSAVSFAGLKKTLDMVNTSGLEELYLGPHSRFSSSYLDRAEIPGIGDIAGHLQTFTLGTLFWYGIKGLKKEICPDFNPTKWIKAKLGNEAKQSA